MGVLKANASLGDSWVAFDLPISQPNTWVTCEIGFDAAALAAFIANGNSGNFTEMIATGEGIWAVVQIDGTPEWTNGYLAGPVPAPAADVWQLAELHFSAADVDLYIDGTLVSTFSDPGGPNIDQVKFGLTAAGPVGDDGIAYIRNIMVGTTRGDDDLFAWLDSETDLAAFSSESGDVSVVADPFGPAPPPAAPRFFQGYEWRFLVTDLNTVSVSWANGLLTNRSVAFILDEPSVITADVMPNSRQVNEMFGGDDDPRLAQQNRLLYAFRREGGSPPWVCRAAGVIQAIQDQGDPDAAVSHISAYDPWRYLDARPCMQADGSLPTAEIPLNFLSQTGGSAIVALLQATLDNVGPMFIDFGQTAFYGGVIEETEFISYECQQGTMVGATLTELCDVGHLDIVLRAVYDPDNRPGITHELSVYNLAGVERPRVVFGWDRMNRAVTEIDRMRDGSPGAWVNVVQYFTNAGFPIPPGGPLMNGLSVAKYGAYWSQQFFPAQGGDTDDAVAAMARQAIILAKQGLRTTTVNPTPQRSKIPLVDYELGDRVKIFASKGLRVISEGYQRVQGIPIQIDDDGIEHVAGLLCSPDWVEAGS